MSIREGPATSCAAEPPPGATTLSGAADMPSRRGNAKPATGPTMIPSISMGSPGKAAGNPGGGVNRVPKPLPKPLPLGASAPVMWVSAAIPAKIANSKMNGGRVEIELNKAVGMVTLSDELMQFSPNMSGMVMDSFAEGLADAYGYAILFGDNVGKPKGIMHGDPAVAADEAPRIAVPKATGQAAGTIVYDNVLRMQTAMTPKCRANGI